MTKYAALIEHLKAQKAQRIPMTFAQIERVLKFPLPDSARRHRAWWSNNPDNNVMTRAWREAGFRTEQVDLERGQLVFRRESATASPGMAEASEPFSGKLVDKVDHPLFGCMAGTVTFAEDYDPSEPADPDWVDRLERKSR